MKAIIYTRVSSDEQVKGTSLESQEQLCREYCDRSGMVIAGVFREEGESAKTADRTQLLAAIEYCRAHRGDVGAFVVAKLDRFARNAEDHILVRRQLSSHGVALHSVSEPIGDGPSGRFIEMVLAASSEFDNAVRRQRCTDGMKAKMRQGIYPWKPPVGYISAQNRKHGRKKTEPDAPDPIVFPILASTLRQYARGEIKSQTEFRDLLDARGFAAARGCRTPKQTVDAILGRHLRFYAGVLLDPWTGEEIAGLHEPMISRDEMIRIKEVRSNRGRGPAKRDRSNPLFPLRRTALCSACHGPLTGSVSRGNGGRYAYYHCFNPNCPLRGRATPKELLEAAFRSELKRIGVAEPFLALLASSLVEEYRDRGDSRAAGKEVQSREVAALNERRRRILELREDGSYSVEIFRERLTAVDESIAKISGRQPDDGPLPDESQISLVIEKAALLLMEPDHFWDEMSPEEKRRFQKLAFPDGFSYDAGNGFRTASLGPIFAVNRAFVDSESQVVHLLGHSSNQILASLRELAALVPAAAAGLPAAA